MKFHNKGLFKRASLFLALAHFITFMSIYMTKVLFTDKAFFAYLWIFIQKATFLLLPLVSALIVLMADAYIGKKAALVGLIPLSAVKAVYSLPYYYLKFVYDPMYDSIDAILFSLASSVGEIAVLYVFTLLIFFIMRFILKSLDKKRLGCDALLSEKTVLNFANPTSLTFMISALICFLYSFISEIVSTVTFILAYAGRISGGEIAYIVFSYVFEIALLALYYFALAYIKNYIIKLRLREETAQ